MTFILLLLPPVVAVLLTFVVRPYRSFVGGVNVLLSLASLGAALAFAAQAIAGGEAPTYGPGELLRADSFSALLMVCVTITSSLALFFSHGLGRGDHLNDEELRRKLISPSADPRSGRRVQ